MSSPCGGADAAALLLGEMDRLVGDATLFVGDATLFVGDAARLDGDAGRFVGDGVLLFWGDDEVRFVGEEGLALLVCFGWALFWVLLTVALLAVLV